MSALKEQREQQGVIVPVGKTALMRSASPVGAYLAAHGVGMSGTFFKLSKEGKFIKTSDDEEVPAGTFVVIYDQIQAGWIKFMGKGNPPERKQGPIFDGFVPPNRDMLGEDDEDDWELGLNGQPTDPWQFQVLIPMQHVESGELFVFNTSSKTGRRACDNLIRLCGRMQQTDPDHYPIIKLRVGGFQHRDDRVGWVNAPAFDPVGKASKADTSMTDTSVSGDLNDEIPWK
jgi:hypothetical protein